VVAVVVVLLAGVAGWTATKSARAAPVDESGSFYLNVTTTSPYAFVPDTFQNIPTNTTVQVTVTDADSLAHTFSIVNWEGVVLPSTADIASVVAAHGTLFTKNVSGSGDVEKGSFTSPGPGWYEFVCEETGHFAYGMYGFIAFGMALPANLTVSAPSTGPGAAVFIIIGTIVSLVVIAIVLGFVAGRRRGSEFEMPPERLGYAEPEKPGERTPPPSPPLPPG
jgi:plastocyanin